MVNDYIIKKLLYNLDKILDRDVLVVYDFVKFLLNNKRIISDKDYKVLEYCKDFYDKNNFFPIFNDLKSIFEGEYDFLEERYDDSVSLYNDIKVLRKEVVDKLRIYLVNEYASGVLTLDNRIMLLDKLSQLENSLKIEYEDSVAEIKKYSISEIIDNKRKYDKGIITNIEELDSVTNGISAGKLLTIMGGPGSFKTTFAINMFYLENVMTDNNIMFLSFEIPKDELYLKLLVRHSRGYISSKYGELDIKVLKVLKGDISKTEEEYLKEVESDYRSKKRGEVYIMDMCNFDFTSLMVFKAKLVEYIEMYKVSTVYLDHLHLLRSVRMRGYSDTRDMVNDIVSMFRGVSVEKNVRFVLLAQVNKDAIRKVEKNGGIYSMTDISEYSSIERDSYYILSLYSNDNLKGSNLLKYQLLKHRDGMTMTDPRMCMVDARYFYVGSDVNNIIKNDISQVNVEIERSLEDDVDYAQLFK